MRAGLAAISKDLSPWPKYFYDAEESRLCEEITAQPEYYQTGAELSILTDLSDEIVARTRCGELMELVELGSGSASKTRALIDAMLAADGVPPRYVPLDVSESALRESGERLVPSTRASRSTALSGTSNALWDACSGARRTAGGSSPFSATPSATSPRRSGWGFSGPCAPGCARGDYALTGLDLVKDTRTIEAAYNDAAGVTARFNRNMIRVNNRRLGAGLDPDLFSHRAAYNAAQDRIEIWPHSEDAQSASTPNLEARFGRGEGVRTEISTKFTPDSAYRTLGEAGLELLDL